MSVPDTYSTIDKPDYIHNNIKPPSYSLMSTPDKYSTEPISIEDIVQDNNKHVSALFWSITNRDQTASALLINKGVDLNFKNENGFNDCNYK